jgi:hypothetical protein
MFVAPRGQRHGFSNPAAEQVLVLGIWAPPEPALAFMRDIGAALRPDARLTHAQHLRPARQSSAALTTAPARPRQWP